MDELKQKWDEKQNDAGLDEKQEIEKLYGDAIMAANANEIDRAEEKVSEFEKRLEGIGKDDSEEHDWKNMANGIAGETKCPNPECRTFNPKDSEKCYKCGKTLDIEEVKKATVVCEFTSKDIGILTYGVHFVVVFEAGSVYPSPEPVILSLTIHDDNVDNIMFPVYALDVQKDNKLENQAVLFLKFPNGAPRHTPFDLAFTLDNDGLLGTVKVSLRDGSGWEAEMIPERGSRATKMLDKAKQAWNFKQRLNEITPININEALDFTPFKVDLKPIVNANIFKTNPFENEFINMNPVDMMQNLEPIHVKPDDTPDSKTGKRNQKGSNKQ